MSRDGAREKFYQVIYTMTTSPASIQKRLVSAGIFLIQLKPEEELPNDLREEFRAVIRELTKEPDTEGIGTLEATTQNLTDEDASEIAGRIFSMYIKLRGGI